MGQLAFLKMFILVAISLDVNDNRHWKFINEQITKVFNGERTISIDIEK